MGKLKALLLTQGMHGMISQVEGMAKALNTEYSHKIATYGKGSKFDQKLAKGFVELWGMQSTEANKLQKKNSKKL